MDFSFRFAHTHVVFANALIAIIAEDREVSDDTNNAVLVLVQVHQGLTQRDELSSILMQQIFGIVNQATGQENVLCASKFMTGLELLEKFRAAEEARMKAQTEARREEWKTRVRARMVKQEASTN